MCEEINKIYERINEFERETEHALDELWDKVVALEDRIKKVQEAWKNE